MSASHLRHGVIILGIVLLLTFLFVQSRAVDFATHARFSGHLRQLQEVDTTLNQDILKVRDGLLAYYDSLVTASADLHGLSHTIRRSIPSFISAEGQRDITRLLDAYAEVLASKARNLERFKSDNAILKNSLQYFPLAATEVAEEAGAHRLEQKPVTELQDLLRDLLVYTLLVREDMTTNLQARIDNLRDKRDAFASTVERSKLDAVLTHAQTILTYAPRVNALIAELLAPLLAQRSVALYTAYNHHYQRALQTADGYRLVFNLLSVALFIYIAYIVVSRLADTLAIVTAAKRRMEEELNVAHDIQMSMLPLIFPPFPEHDEFGIFATLSPAREVGGDFYDFYFLNENLICFTVGDVSGKGVPSALFMAVTKTLIKSRASSDFSPASIVTHINDELSRDNESCMFVTLYVAILDLRSGEMVVTNAGHNPPLIKRRGGTVEWLRHRHGPVVGAMPGIAYGQDSVQLERGDTVLLYTDGVTEADDGSGNLFGEERLERALADEGDLSLEPLLHALRSVVQGFEGDEQADDITLLGIRYMGRRSQGVSPELVISIPNDLGEITKVIDAFKAWGEKGQLPRSVVLPMCMALDEFLNNIISYAYKDDQHHAIQITFERVDDGVVITIIDDGIPFNPFTSALPDTTASIEERDVGGLGIHLVKEMMDEVSYQRRVNQNVVKITKWIADDTPNMKGEST